VPPKIECIAILRRDRPVAPDLSGAFGGAVPVPAFGPRVVCTCCGIVGADARPNWTERESLTGRQWR
jgi:hypothetical protein